MIRGSHCFTAPLSTLQPRVHRALSRSRFYGILDTQYVSSKQWVDTCQAMIQGGASIVQLRAKDTRTQRRVSLLESILPIVRKAKIPLVINDDLELALRYPGLGLHIGQDDLPPRVCRYHLGPHRILGLSTHSLLQAKRAMALDTILSYFAVGPVFATQTKPTVAPVGIDLVRKVAALKPRLPFYAIGGITPHNLAEVLAAKARRIVAVSAVLCAADTAAATRAFVETMRAAVS